MHTKNKRLIGLLALVGFLLLIPYAAMKITGEVKWSAFDFAIAGFLLLCTGLAIEFVLRVVTKPMQRLALCAAILLVLFVVWAELAVGLIGTPLAGS
jgi:bacteriorhodopsin